MVAVKLPEIRTYSREKSITFRKTAEKFGGLSNMAGGYLLNVNGVRILTSEALYQACRFPHLPEVQRQIIAERSPMTAKMKSKPYRDDSRPDWDVVRTKIMRWCLQVKLVQNWDKFSKLLLETGDLPIVEDSHKDNFWGAKPIGEALIGVNALGRLLMELREQIKSKQITENSIVIPPIEGMLLYNESIPALGSTKTMEPTASISMHELSEKLRLLEEKTQAQDKVIALLHEEIISLRNILENNDLLTKTCKELRIKAKERGIRNYSKMNKAELVKELIENQEEIRQLSLLSNTKDNNCTA